MAFDALFEDVKGAPEAAPVIPQGDYNAVIGGWELAEVETQEGPRDVLRIYLTLQGNPGIMLSDGSLPVDGQTIEYTIFLPDERDKQVPSRYGRGSMYDVGVRRLKSFFKACGVDLGQHPNLESALDACKGAQVRVRITNVQAEDGTIYDRVQRIL